MIDHLMTDQRGRVVIVLTAILGVMILLWFVRGPELDVSNVATFAISLLLVPLASIAIYGLMYLAVRTTRIPERALRLVCGVLFFGAAAFLAMSAMFAVYDFATHRSLPPPNLVAFGVALGAMKSWDLQLRPSRPAS